MRRWCTRTAVLIVTVCLLVGSLWAANCPYCGQTYGEGSSSSSAYIARVRAEHEANCPARRRSGSSSSGSSNYNAQRRWERAESYYNQAQACYDRGDYDGAISKCGAALWNSWGNRKYTDLLQRAQKRKAAQVAHQTGGTYERLGPWDLAARFYEDALKGHPENAANTESLARARRERGRAEQKKLDDRMAALADELSRTYPPGGITFKVPEGVSRKPSIDRIVVPTPDITPRRYFQIKTPTDWPTVSPEVVTLTNQTLVKLQDGAEWGAGKAVDMIHDAALSNLTERIPGYGIYSSLKEKGQALYGGLRKAIVGMLDRDLEAVRTGVVAVANPNDTGEAADAHDAQFHAMGTDARRDFLKLSGRSAWWGIRGQWRVGETESAPDKPTTVPIRRKKSDPYPDPFRLGPWVPQDR